jgi:hypothetical protein
MLHRVKVEVRTTYAIWENQQPFVSGTSGIRRPEGNIVAVIITLPGQVRQSLFSIYISHECSCLR